MKANHALTVMEYHENRIEHALANTHVIRPPQQTLATFGATVIHYYIVTVPSYMGLMNSGEDTVIREGNVSAEQPQVVTPYYLLHLDGFTNDARRYFEEEADFLGPSAPGLLYSYQNNSQSMNVVSGDVTSVGKRLAADLDYKGERLAAVIQGVDDLWDVSLLKFIYELTRRSLASNFDELDRKGLLEIDPSGVPRQHIENLFKRALTGELDVSVLKRELDRMGVFEEYQDRFFSLFRRR